MDDFNRADSGTVGNGWQEGVDGNTGLEIVSNELKGVARGQINRSDYALDTLYVWQLMATTNAIEFYVGRGADRISLRANGGAIEYYNGVAWIACGSMSVGEYIILNASNWQVLKGNTTTQTVTALCSPAAQASAFSSGHVKLDINTGGIIDNFCIADSAFDCGIISSVSSVVFQGQTPSNATALYVLTQSNFTVNSTSGGLGGSVNSTHYLFNGSGFLLRQNNGTNQQNYTSNFSGLTVGTYYFNATVFNGSAFNMSETRALYVYNLSTGQITSLANGSSVGQRLVNFTWQNATVNPVASGVVVRNFSLRIENQTGSTLAIIYNGSQLNLTNFDIYAQNLNTGIYTLRLTSQDNQGNVVNTSSQFNLTRNALLNVTVKERLSNGIINTFNITIIGDNGFTYNASTTTGLIEIDVVRNQNYTIYLNSLSVISSSMTVNASQLRNNATFVLNAFNSINIYFYNEVTLTLVNTTPVYLDLVSSIFSNNYSSNGTGFINISLLSPTTYLARYSASGFSERFYSFDVDNDSSQTVNLYLRNDTDSILVTVQDNALQKVEGAVVKAQKKVVSTGEFVTVEIGQTNFNGEILFSLSLNDEFYRFIVEVDGQTKLTTDESYLYDTEITLTLPPEGGTAEDIFTYLGIENTLTFSTTLNRFLFTFNDPSNTVRTYCLRTQTLEGIYNTSCTTGVAGSLTSYVEPINGTYYLAKSSVYFDIEQPFLTLSYSYPDGTTIPSTGDAGKLAVFLQYLLSMIFIYAALKAMPELIPLAFGLSLVFGKLFNLNALEWTTITAVGFAMLVMSAWLGRKKIVG